MPEQILVAPELEDRQELVVMPSVEDFQMLSQDDLASKEMVLKDKLLMRPGEHNGVTYTWDDLKEALATGEEAGLFYDHEDSTKNYVGFVRNLKADDVKQEIRGDLVFLEEAPYKKLKAGAKWGVSPSIDAEKVVRDGITYALDAKFISYSLVLRPAVRDTMLNEEFERGSKVDMENDSKNREIEELAKKKKDEEEKKKEEEEKKKKLEVDLKEELKETKAQLEKFKEAELESSCNDLLNLEKEIGFTSEAEADERLKQLKEISAETRGELKSCHERYIKTLGLKTEKTPEELGEELKENYIKFRARYMKKNPKASESDVKRAFAKLAEEVDDKKKKKYPYPYPKDKGKMSEDLKESQNRIQQNLAEEKVERDKANRLTLDMMHAAQDGRI